MNKWVKRGNIKEGMVICGARVFDYERITVWEPTWRVISVNDTYICMENMGTGDVHIAHYGDDIEFLIKEREVTYQKMETLNVSNSSVLNRLVYNRSAQTLTAEFKNRTVYMYANVLPCVYDTLCFAEQRGLSVGHLFNELVKNV